MQAVVGQFLERFMLNEESALSAGFPGQTAVDGLGCEGIRVPRYTNEFWAADQRRSHSLHEISYRACFKAELPRFFIILLSRRGDLVYDPFTGRGTTLLEAALLGRSCAGNDVNPPCRLLVAPRLDPPELADIARRLESIRWDYYARADIDLSMFFSVQIERMIVALRTYLIDRAASGAEDAVDRWIRMVATNRLTGHSRGFFSVYSLPPNQAVLPDAQRRVNQRLRQTPPDRDVPGITIRKSRSLQADLRPEQRGALRAATSGAILLCQQSQFSAMPDESIDLVVTPPPFLDVVQYAADNWLRCWFNGIEVEDVAARMTTTRSLEDWTHEMQAVFVQLAHALKPRGWIAFEVGDVRGGRILLDECVAPLGIAAGLACRAIVVNRQAFTKTANCWGITNNRRGTNTNRIVLFEKE